MSSKSYSVNGLLLGLYIMWWMCFSIVEENPTSIVRWLNQVYVVAEVVWKKGVC